MTDTDPPPETDAPAALGPTDDDIRLAEALIFASATPVTPPALVQALSDDADIAAVMAALRARYDGRGVEIVEVAGGWQFRTAPDLAPRLRRVIQVPRRLPRVAMETLAIVAYHQPVTRPEIEEIRGASLSQNTMDSLLEAGLITPKGRKEAPGRPTLWGTTPAFLTQFGLTDLRQLPRREDLLLDPDAGPARPAEPPQAPEPASPAAASETPAPIPASAPVQTPGETAGAGTPGEALPQA